MVVCLLVIGFGVENDMAPVWILGTKSKKEALEFIAFGMSGVVATIVAASINRRSDVQEQNNKLIAQGHDNERFENMITNLGHAKVAVRIATFYRFYYLVEKNKEDSSQKLKEDIFEILCSYLRAMSDPTESDEAPSLIEKNKKEYLNERQTLFDILFKDKFKSNNNGIMSYNFPVDLQRISLDKMNLSYANLTFTNLTNSNFTNSNLSNANLTDADLTNANLSGAYLSGTNLIFTNLTFANLSNVYLSNVNLTQAYLSYANLSDANFTDANLTDAYLTEANFIDTDLSGADLTRANLQNTQLQSTKLENVISLEGADFRGVKIGDRPITKDDIPADKGEYYADWNPPPKKEEN